MLDKYVDDNLKNNVKIQKFIFLLLVSLFLIVKKKMFSLLVGPLIPLVHGQSLAFTRFVESIDKDKIIVINTNLEGMSIQKKIFGTIYTPINIFLKVIFRKFGEVT
ncbi:hypothetical protein [Aliarcobacter skirrowii]|uniref:hypothetical protein n=1 Tax=Aliarcobacter skirrowii TaxID=28200 RepID=UPI0029A7397A|nr:hypothetical protein [Aliarcobacter skirrowii]MDX4036788.1 hypothetical protein [Aliarcobacter skirrowii]